MKKKFLSLCLSLLLALSLVPTAAFAATSALTLGQEQSFSAANDTDYHEFTFTPTESGLYKLKISEKNGRRAGGLGVRNNTTQLNAIEESNNAQSIILLIAYMESGKNYIITHYPARFEPQQATELTISLEKISPLSLTTGSATSFTSEKTDATPDLEIFSYTPQTSGWYTLSSSIPGHLSVFTPSWLQGNETFDPNGSDSSNFLFMLSSVGTSAYLNSSHEYYFVFFPEQAGNGAFTIKNAAFSLITTTNTAKVPCGIYESTYATFTPTASGSYTITAVLNDDAGIAKEGFIEEVYISDEQGKFLKTTDTGGDNDTHDALTYDFVSGKTYYIGFVATWLNPGNHYGVLQITNNNATPITDAVVTIPTGPYTYTGAAHTPDISVAIGNKTLTKGTDYTVAYANNINVGTATITVTGIGDYKGTKTATFPIAPAPISGATVTVDPASYAYTGTPITPEVTVKLGQTTLVKDTDYTVAYANNTNVGKATVTITGKGSYTGTKTAEFDITKAVLTFTAGSYLKNTDGVLSFDLDGAPGMPSGENFTYTANAGQNPTGFTPALNGKTLTLTANGSGTVGQKENYVVTAASTNYDVTITVEVTYTDKDVKELNTPAVTPSVTYNGNPAQVYTGTPSIDGETDVEFSITYKGTGDTVYAESTTAPTNAGTYAVTFALAGEEDFVANPIVEPFTINPATPAFTAPTITRITAAAPLSSVTLTGGEVKGVDKAVIPGTFSWSGDTSANVVQGTEYTWTFTPETPNDNYDFSAVTGKLTPWTSGGGGNNGGNSGGSSSGSSGGTTTKPPVTEPETPTDPVTPPPTTTFPDVPADAYYADAVAWAVSKGITTGTGDGNFSPAAPCTRAQVVTFLWRAAGSPAPTSTASFADVPADAYYRDAVLWAVETGITNGTGADAFSPNATVDRAQTVTFLYRYAGSPAASGGGFDDVDSGSYYADAVAWAVSQEITNGTSPTTFAPASNCTRGQTVTLLFRAFAE